MRNFDRSTPVFNRRDATQASVQVSRAKKEGPFALSAAELAAIESEKTRAKLKIKAEHVSFPQVCTFLLHFVDR